MKYRHRDIHTETDRGRETDIYTGRQTNIERLRDRHRQTENVRQR